jgi:hypothetical protein|nr:MAG TPA: hypothetical protein [Caudoviricetes sp.]DAU17114.1 MAG TPA: hypothetical protein [Caudoviricetes sp.]
MHFSRKAIRESANLRMLKQAKVNELQSQLNETVVPVVEFDESKSLKRANRFLNLRTTVRNNLKEAFLFEAIKYFYNESSVQEIEKEELQTTKDTIIMGFIKENGVENILNKFRKRDVVLTDIANFVNESTRAIMEENEEKLKDSETAPEDIQVSVDDRESFIDKMAQQKEEIEDVGAMVQTHVANNVEEFIASNVEDRQQIKDILDDVKEKVASIKAANADVAEQIKESKIMKARREIHKIKNSKKNILECMVNHLSKRVIAENHQAFLDDRNSIKMDKIVETAECMLTMLVLSEAFGFEVNEKEVRELYK